ncbi:MAG TPA: hypothetical protein ENN60_01010 [archaeon]|nr:hypothetical protein [archaeon]
MQKNVLDAGVFVEGRVATGVTTPGVAREARLPPEGLPGVEIMAPGGRWLEKARATAQKTGDLDVLSPADLEVVALALEIGGIVVTSDFAVQNVARAAGLEVEPLGKSIRKGIEWAWYCPACGRTTPRGGRKGECGVCGTEMKRRPRKGK